MIFMKNIVRFKLQQPTYFRHPVTRETSCAGGRHNMPRPAPPPASWHLTFWPWKWCPSHVQRGLPLC